MLEAIHHRYFISSNTRNATLIFKLHFIHFLWNTCRISSLKSETSGIKNKTELMDSKRWVLRDKWHDARLGQNNHAQAENFLVRFTILWQYQVDTRESLRAAHFHNYLLKQKYLIWLLRPLQPEIVTEFHSHFFRNAKKLNRYVLDLFIMLAMNCTLIYAGTSSPTFLNLLYPLSIEALFL